MLTLMFEKTEDHGALTLHLEHSLASLSKWEQMFEKPFFGKDPQSPDESISYIQLMVQEEVSTAALRVLLKTEDYETIAQYINAKASATWFREEPGPKRPAEAITSELVYYWMLQFNIPFQPCEDWHFNRLMTLVKICGIKQTRPKRMSRQAQMEQYRQLNAERRARLGTSG